MKTKTILLLLVSIFFTSACEDATSVLIPLTATSTFPAPSKTNLPTITNTPEPKHVPTASNTPIPIPTSTNAIEGCFINIPFIPEKTKMSEVISTWGNPREKQIFSKKDVYWYYDRVDIPNTAIKFQEEIVFSVDFYPINCTFEEIVAELGQPNKVTIAVFDRNIDSSITYSQSLHYSELGFYYSRPCDETQDCFSFRANDRVDRKVFYSPNKKIKDYIGNNMYSYVYDWHGFDVNAEEIENKIKE